RDPRRADAAAGAGAGGQRAGQAPRRRTGAARSRPGGERRRAGTVVQARVGRPPRLTERGAGVEPVATRVRANLDLRSGVPSRLRVAAGEERELPGRARRALRRVGDRHALARARGAGPPAQQPARDRSTLLPRPAVSITATVRDRRGSARLRGQRNPSGSTLFHELMLLEETTSQKHPPPRRVFFFVWSARCNGRAGAALGGDGAGAERRRAALHHARATV